MPYIVSFDIAPYHFVLYIAGALFEPEYEGQKRAFEWAVQSVNLRNDILGPTLVLEDDDIVQPHDSFGAQRKGQWHTNGHCGNEWMNETTNG